MTVIVYIPKKLSKKIVDAIHWKYKLYWEVAAMGGFELRAQTAFHENGSVSTRKLADAYNLEAVVAYAELIAQAGGKLNTKALLDRLGPHRYSEGWTPLLAERLNKIALLA